MPFKMMIQVPSQPISWLWKNRLGLGKLAMLDGNPEMGKSLITLDSGRKHQTYLNYCQPLDLVKCTGPMILRKFALGRPQGKRIKIYQVASRVS